MGNRCALIEPEGAFYLHFRVDGFFGGSVRDATAWCSRLLEDQGVALVPGPVFGDDRSVRMSYPASDGILEKALGRIRRVSGRQSPKSLVDRRPAGP